MYFGDKWIEVEPDDINTWLGGTWLGKEGWGGRGVIGTSPDELRKTLADLLNGTYTLAQMRFDFAAVMKRKRIKKYRKGG